MKMMMTDIGLHNSVSFGSHETFTSLAKHSFDRCQCHTYNGILRTAPIQIQQAADLMSHIIEYGVFIYLFLPLFVGG